ncbi:MAG: alpha/beta fold hydrolase [Streptosporangiaceae bacterium]
MTAGGGLARLGDLELYYETLGSGPPLVLIHGSLMTIGLMNDYPALLAAHRQVIAVELQAHGHTRDIGRPLRYEMLADDIAGLLDHLGLAQADLFGFSLGAAVATQVAIRHPDRVRRLVCMSVSYRTAGMHAEMTEAVDVDSSIEQLVGSPYQRAYEAVAPDPESWPDLIRKVLELDAQPQDWPAEEVAGIRAPAMLIAADNDIVRLEHAVEMYHLLGGGVFGDVHGLPASRLAVIPGTTHVGLSDRATWVVPMVAEFLDPVAQVARL